MSLIQTLNASAHLSPDQIAKKLGGKGWIRFGDLTDDDFLRLDKKPMVVVEWDNNRFRMTHSPSYDWTFWGVGDESYFRNRLGNYFGILTEDYTDGDFPDPPA